jgi:hypothetical protein
MYQNVQSERRDEGMTAKLLSFWCPEEVDAAIVAEQRRIQREAPGIKPTTSAAIRSLILKGDRRTSEEAKAAA